MLTVWLDLECQDQRHISSLHVTTCSFHWWSNLHFIALDHASKNQLSHLGSNFEKSKLHSDRYHQTRSFYSLPMSLAHSHHPHLKLELDHQRSWSRNLQFEWPLVISLSTFKARQYSWLFSKFSCLSQRLQLLGQSQKVTSHWWWLCLATSYHQRGRWISH